MIRHIPAFVVLFIQLAACQQQLSTSISNYMSPCRRHSPDFNACIKATLTSMIPKLSKNGIPELGVPRLDPLEVPELKFSYNKLSDIAGNMVLANSTVIGLKDLTISSVRSHIVEKKTFSVDIELLLPKIMMWGDFAATGRFGIFPVSGSGPYNLTTGEIRGTWRLHGKPVTVDGVDYIQLDQFLLTPVISEFRVDAENVLRGNPQLSKMLVSFTNKFWHHLYEQSLPDFEQSLDKIGQDLLNKVFMKVPYDQLFPIFQDPSAPQKASTQKPTQQKPPASKPPAAKPPASKPPASKPPSPKPPAAKPPTPKPPPVRPPVPKPPAAKPPTPKPPPAKPPTPKPPPAKPPTPKPPSQKPTTQKLTTVRTTRKPTTKRTGPTTTTTFRTTTKRRKFGFFIG